MGYPFPFTLTSLSTESVMKQQIVITTSSFGALNSAPLDILRDRGFEVVLNPYGKALTTAEAIELCRSAVGIVAGTEPLNQAFMDACPNLQAISRCGTGTDNVDLVYASQRGIPVFNTPDAPTLAVAELTVGLMLDLLRQISRQDALLRQGSWKKLMGFQLSGKRVGFVGFGRIARKIAELIAPFDCQTVFADPMVADGTDGLARMALDDLLAWSDIVSLHASAREPLIGQREFDLMRPGGWLVNTARGRAVDEKALLDALNCGHLAGAALDVFSQEPYRGPLRDLCNVVLTPHIGSYAQESRILMETEAAQNLLKGIKECQ